MAGAFDFYVKNKRPLTSVPCVSAVTSLASEYFPFVRRVVVLCIDVINVEMKI